MKIGGAQYNIQSAFQSGQEQTKTDGFQNTLEKAMTREDDVALKEACRQFEGYFIQQMFKEMRKTTQFDEGLIPKSQGEKIFEEMLDDEYAKSATKAGGIGLADMMYKQLSKQMQNQYKPQSMIDQKS